MKRMILALLALIGLIAQPATLQARGFGSGAAQVGLLDGGQVQARKLAPRAEVSARPAPKAASLSRSKRTGSFAVPAAPLAPAVIIKADRAHE